MDFGASVYVRWTMRIIDAVFFTNIEWQTIDCGSWRMAHKIEWESIVNIPRTDESRLYPGQVQTNCLAVVAGWVL